MRKRRFLVRLLALLTAIFLCAPVGGLAEGGDLQTQEDAIAQQIAASDNPLINPGCTVLTDEQKISLQPDVINILLLGIDDQEKNYTYRTEMAHTDAMMLLSINTKEDRAGKMISLISIPRDTIAYVPGVKGIYKINCAINCGDALSAGVLRADDPSVVIESELGFATVEQTMSWMLGGVQIDYYCAVTMGAMQALGDVIGGVDYDLDMAYTGHSGVWYPKGMQHLDGMGIVDYFRARKNATDDSGSDQARTNRQREMMEAILDKLASDKALILKALSSLQTNDQIREGFYTDISTAAMTRFISIGLNLLANTDFANGDSLDDLVGSYAIDGDYTNAFGNWKFRFPNQEHRLEMLREVFGIDAEALHYISYEYAQWLYESGFQAVRYLAVADEIRNFIAENYQYESVLVDVDTDGQAGEKLALSAEQTAALETFTTAYGDALQTFLAAAGAVDEAAMAGDKYDQSLTTAMTKAASNLQDQGNELAKLVGYPAGVGAKAEKVKWGSGVYMDEDPLINEIYVNFR